MPSLLAMTHRQTTQKTIIPNELLVDRFHRLAFSRRARVERRLEHPLSLKQYTHTQFRFISVFVWFYSRKYVLIAPNTERIMIAVVCADRMTLSHNIGTVVHVSGLRVLHTVSKTTKFN